MAVDEKIITEFTLGPNELRHSQSTHLELTIETQVLMLFGCLVVRRSQNQWLFGNQTDQPLTISLRLPEVSRE